MTNFILRETTQYVDEVKYILNIYEEVYRLSNKLSISPADKKDILSVITESKELPAVFKTETLEKKLKILNSKLHNLEKVSPNFPVPIDVVEV